MSEVPKSVSEYMKQIGSQGGKKSKRVLTKEQSAAMLAKRKPKRLKAKAVSGETYSRADAIAGNEEKI